MLISFCYGDLYKIMPKKLLAIKSKLPLCSWASLLMYLRASFNQKVASSLPLFQLYGEYDNIFLLQAVYLFLQKVLKLLKMGKRF